MSQILIQATEQADLKNRDYPNQYYPFFNGYVGTTPAPSFLPLAFNAAFTIKTIEVDFNNHPAKAGEAYQTIFGVNAAHRFEIHIFPDGILRVYFGGTVPTEINVPASTWKFNEYVKLRLEVIGGTTWELFDVSVQNIKTSLGTAVADWLPDWTFGVAYSIGALPSGPDYIRGWEGFIGTYFIEYQDLSSETYNMRDELNAPGGSTIQNITRTDNPRDNYPATRLKKFGLDTLDNETITNIRQAANINDPAKIKSDFTQSFALPFSQTNNQFFAHCYDINITEEFFNIYKRSYVTIYNTAGQVLVSGVMLVNSIDQTNEVYNVTVYGETTSLWETIGETFLSDLPAEFWTRYDHINSRDNIINSWTGTAVNSAGTQIPELFYPIETYGYPAGSPYTSAFFSNGLQFQNFRPSLQVKALFDAILKDAGYTYESTFMDQTEWTDLYLQLAPLRQISINSAAFFDVAVDNLQDIRPDIADKGNSYHKFVFKNLPVSENDPDGAYDNATGYYTPKYTGALVFGMTWVIQTDAQEQLTSVPTFQVQITDSVPGQLRIGNPLDIASEGLPNEPLTLVENPPGSGVYDASGTHEVTVYTQTGVPFAFTGIVSGLTTGQTDYINWGFGFRTVRSDGLNINDQVRNESMYGITLKQKGLLGDVTKMFNLIWEPIDDSTFKIEPFEAWLGQGEKIDWTEKLDRNGLIGTNIDERARQIRFRYGEMTEGLAIRSFLERGVTPNSGRFEPNNTDWLKSEEEIKLNVAAPFLEQASINQFFIPMHYTREEGNPTPINSSHMIGYKVTYPTLDVSNQPINFFIWDVGSQTYTETGTVRTLSPYKDMPLTNETKTLEFNLYANTVNHIVGRSPSGLFEKYAYGSLMSEYWDAWFSEVYNDKAKIFKAKFNLNAADAAVRLNSKIFVKDAFYRINKLSYPANSDGLATIELIKIIDFDLSKLTAWNCSLRQTGLTDGMVTFEDAFGSFSWGTKDCCQAVNGVWFSFGEELINGGTTVPAGEFRCYSQEVQGTPQTVLNANPTPEPGTGWYCMLTNDSVELLVQLENISAQLAVGWILCDSDTMAICEIADPLNVQVINKVDLCNWLNLDWEPCETLPWTLCKNGGEVQSNSLANLKVRICNQGYTFGPCL